MHNNIEASNCSLKKSMSVDMTLKGKVLLLYEKINKVFCSSSLLQKVIFHITFMKRLTVSIQRRFLYQEIQYLKLPGMIFVSIETHQRL